MADGKPGLIRRFFGAIWATLNFTRVLLLNAIFLILLIFLFSVVFSSSYKLAPRSALILDPKGSIVEQYSADASSRAFSSFFGEEIHEVQLRDILAAIDAAAKDSRIERMVIVPDDINSAGISTLREIGAAIERFKAAGKEVIAVSDGMTQGQYYLAAHADRILLHPEGGILLEGLGRYRMYYKEALDRLGVDVHLFRVGEYKSAGEPYILDRASPQAREADLFWMNDLWNALLGEIATMRKIDVGQLTADVNNMPALIKENNGDLAALALKQKWVDQLATRDEARDALIAKGEKDTRANSFRQIRLKDYVALVDRETLPGMGAQVAIVVAEGEIVPGDRQPGMVGGESTAKLLRKARENDKVKAIVLRVNSPGGEVFASEQIRREVELTRKAHKPIVVSMGDVAASGGYWISMNADRIYAQPTTITGSIGIFGLIMNFPNTLAKIGVHTDGVGTAPLAGAFDVRRALDPKLGEVIQSVIDRGYQNFITKVAAAREKTPQEIDQIARGRVWSGTQAKARGLVDELGGLRDATLAAANLAQLGDKYYVDYVEKELSAWQRLALSLSSETLASFGRSAGLQLPGGLTLNEELRHHLQLLRSLDGNRPGVFAYCFCEVK